MKRLCGLMLFCFGSGMALILFVPKSLIVIAMAAVMMLLGYLLFRG